MPNGRECLGLTLAVILACPLAAGPLSAAQTRGTGLVVTRMTSYQNWKLYPGDEDCPDGYNPGLQELYLSRLRPGALRDKMAVDAPNRTYAAGAFNGLDQCLNPGAYEDPPNHPVQGRLAYGMNLDGTADGAATPQTCAHAKFTAPDGTPGIDNQFYRAMGCSHAWRPKTAYGGGFLEDYHQGARKDGEMTTLIEIGAPRPDGTVDVGLYASSDATVFDSQGQPLPYVSLSASDARRWGAVAHGRIKDGVLTTDPVDLRLPFAWNGLHAEGEDYYLRGARLRLELAADGSAKGMLAGYYDIEAAFGTFFSHGKVHGRERPDRAQLLPASFGYSCPASWQALQDYADGYPDPATGRCTAISTAMEVTAVPAFVIHPRDGTTKSAEAGQ
jgi:hypothetical protein